MKSIYFLSKKIIIILILYNIIYILYTYDINYALGIFWSSIYYVVQYNNYIYILTLQYYNNMYILQKYYIISDII